MIGDGRCAPWGSLGNHPLGTPDWAGRTACPCGTVRVYPPDTHGLPLEPPAGGLAQDAGEHGRHAQQAALGPLAPRRNSEPSTRLQPHPNRRHHQVRRVRRSVVASVETVLEQGSDARLGKASR